MKPRRGLHHHHLWYSPGTAPLAAVTGMMIVVGLQCPVDSVGHSEMSPARAGFGELSPARAGAATGMVWRSCGECSHALLAGLWWSMTVLGKTPQSPGWQYPIPLRKSPWAAQPGPWGLSCGWGWHKHLSKVPRKILIPPSQPPCALGAVLMARLCPQL